MRAVARAASGPRFVPALVSHGLFFVSGLALVTYNKHLYRGQFRFPITLILCTSLANAAVLAAFAALFRRSALRSLAARLAGAPWDLAARVVPIGVLVAVDAALTNEAFVSISVPLTEVVKAALPAVIIAARVAAGSERLTPLKCGVVLALSCGVALTSWGEGGTVALGGLLDAVGALLSAAGKLLFLQAMFSGGRNALTPLEGLLCYLPVAVVTLAVPWALLERDRLLASPFLATREAARGTAGSIGVAAALVIVLNTSSAVAISVTSALALVVTGIVRLVFIMALSAVLFPGFRLAPLNGFGMALAVAGVVGYQYERARSLGIVGGAPPEEREGKWLDRDANSGGVGGGGGGDSAEEDDGDGDGDTDDDIDGADEEEITLLR